MAVTSTALRFSEPADRAAAGARAVAWWLIAVAAMVFIMIVIGGMTRLTESGLSITEWQPITGTLPPLSDADWQTLFDKYRESPQFRQMFPTLTLAGFKGIFWLEYIHRLWGRLIGAAFLLPFLWFWIRGRIPKGYWPALLGLFALGGLQGGVGWLMVASGLVDRPSVSHYRLATHLALAVIIYVAMLWTAFGLMQPRGPNASHAGLRRWSRVVYGLIAVTIIYGAFVAGLRAGWIYNTFPWMGDGLVPAGYWLDSLGWRNLVENHDTVQFNHRLLATLTLLSIAVLWGAARRAAAGIRRAATLLTLSVLLQYGLGITTILLFAVDVARPPLAGGVAIGTLHQAGAMLLVTAAVWFAHAARRAEPGGRAGSRVSAST